MAQPPKGEYAPIDSLTRVHNWTGALLANDDAIIAQRGGDPAIYRELLRDDQVGSALEQRFLAVISREWEVIPGGDSPADQRAADDLKEDLAALEFDKITRQLLHAVHYGYSVAECMWKRRDGRVALDDLLVRPAERFRRGLDGGIYLLHPKKPQGERMPERKFLWITHGAENSSQLYGRGLAHRLYWPVFFKRNGMKYWAIFLEKFSQPTASAALPRAMMEDPVQRARALEFLEAIQVDSAVLRPDDIPVELIEAARSGTGDYDSMRKAMNEAITKIVLSQTMTTDNGSSRAQAEVHMDVRDDIVKADADMISEALHRGPIAWWSEWNHPDAAPPKVWRRMEREEDQNDRADRDTKILQMGYKPTPDYIEETYGPGWVPADQAPTDDLETALEAAFAEGDSTKALHRADQQAIAEAARHYSGDHEELLGERVEQLLAYLEETDDAETFKARLAELVDAPPPAEAVNKLERTGLFARLLGNLRTQR
ncbi:MULTISPECIES: DUF935 family protein [unclassified Thioalkalivibrio]|uniref:phage portal protein family protein n=1 Tax=unclassified Thioalkalivibrio TaxID=2621013 RepID=UPI00036646C9|nr:MULTISPECIES: DUF935 family protein [unclassified Thioalkalivibrio]